MSRSPPILRRTRRSPRPEPLEPDAPAPRRANRDTERHRDTDQERRGLPDVGARAVLADDVAAVALVLDGQVLRSELAFELLHQAVGYVPEPEDDALGLLHI